VSDAADELRVVPEVMYRVERATATMLIEKLHSARQLLTLWMWECKIQGWMLHNRAIEELLQATERELGER
jgi:hypothetical protein